VKFITKLPLFKELLSYRYLLSFFYHLLHRIFTKIIAILQLVSLSNPQKQLFT